jgi:hypothetical protein
MECQLCVCLAYHLLLSLRKSHIFPQQFEVVGNDVCADGNLPAQSKHQLLSTWPKSKLVKDIAKFIGSVQFYSKYINHFELQVTPLRELTINTEHTYGPCFMRFNHKRLVVLRTNFLSKCFDYAVCQPGTDTASEQAMAAYQAGQDFAFMTMDSSAVL